MCIRDRDYPDILEELEKEPFRDLLDAGCGPAPMISLLSKKYPDRHYTGLDLTPAMIEQAKKKNISNATFVVGAVSYTHLDVYKRQGKYIVIMPKNRRYIFSKKRF